ncbi:MAG: Uma2 family endonuclease [Actinomycetota bacterium]
MPSELPSGPVLYELDNGRLIKMSPPGDLHGAVELTITAELKFQGDRAGHGKARCGEVAVVLWRNPDRVVGADVVFIANSSLPIRRSPEGYLETIPDLVVKVVSKIDTRPYVARKVEDYLEAGVRVVWVADPDDETVTVHGAGAAPRVLRGDDTLTVEKLIPGFRLRVADAFVV